MRLVFSQSARGKGTLPPARAGPERRDPQRIISALIYGRLAVYGHSLQGQKIDDRRHSCGDAGNRPNLDELRLQFSE